VLLAPNGKYYIYPTGGNQFYAYSSTDLTNWVNEGVIFDLGPQCSWADRDGWAPSMVYRNNKYYFYYTAEAKIGVAVGNTPTGPFTDLGYALIASDPYVTDIIDPMVFVDDNGQAYLYYGGSNGSRMAIRQLNPDMTSFSGSVLLATPQNYTEAPYMVKRNGTYYLMYSNGPWYNGDYNVQYATSSSPTGPWTYKGQVLASQGNYTGPGHHAVLKMPGCDEYYIIYHRYENGDSSPRKVAIERMYFNPDETIAPIVMTNTGVVARPVNAPCRNGAPAVVSGGVYYLESLAYPGYKFQIVGPGGLYGGIQNTREVLASDWTSNEHRWKLVDAGSGAYYIESTAYAGYRFQIVGPGGLYDGIQNTREVLASNWTSNEHRWKLVDAGSGAYYIESTAYAGYRFQIVGPGGLYGGIQNTREVLASNWTSNEHRWRLVLASAARIAADQPYSEGDQLAAYPNPAGSNVTVRYRLQESGLVSLTLYDAKGQLVQTVYQGKGPADSPQEHNLNAGKLNPGLYLLRLTTPAGSHQQKLLVTH
jgi:hypothetical protein